MMSEKMTDEEIDKLLANLESPEIDPAAATRELAAQAIRQLRGEAQYASRAGLDVRLVSD